jgi:hypothetical protein
MPQKYDIEKILDETMLHLFQTLHEVKNQVSVSIEHLKKLQNLIQKAGVDYG